MEKYFIIYNPQSGGGHGRRNAKKLDNILEGNLIYVSMPKINDFKAFFKSVKHDHLVLCGGDGTLNYFINKTKDIKYKNKILYYASGTGNDFLNDIGPNKANEVIDITNFLKDLPSIYINNNEYKYLNGVGLGIDGYACFKVMSKKVQNIKSNPSYVIETLKGFLHGFKPTNAIITVDKNTYEFKNIWMISIMNGRYYGGGVKIAPFQDRLNKTNEQSIIILSTKNKLKIIKGLLSLKKGNHLKHKDIVHYYTGKKITAKFDIPSFLQYDGEVINNVDEFSVKVK